MAKTPNTYGRFIGRVGGLAVALGIGAALVDGAGIALADDGAPGAAGASGADGASASTGSESTKQPDTADGDDDADPVSDDPVSDNQDTDTDTDEGVDDEQSEDAGAVSGSVNDNDAAHKKGNGATEHESFSRLANTTPEENDPDVDISDVTDAQDRPTGSAPDTTPVQDAPAVQAVALSDAPTAMGFASLSEPAPTQTTTGLSGFVGTVLSAFGFGAQAASGDPVAPPQAPMLWTMLGWVRREIGTLVAPFVGHSTPVAALVAENASTTESPLATEEQLAAERITTQTARTLPVALMKIILRQQFLNAAEKQYPDGLDAGSLAALDKAVNEYAVAAAFQQQLLDSMNPTVVTQVAPPHIWFGQNVPGGRILYDNPDTIYRFMGVNGASEYEIHGQFLDYPNDKALPADTSFSVLEGLAGTTSSILTANDLVVDPDGRFVITVSTEPADGRPNHLQLTSGSTIIAARNTLGDWTTENPMTLSIERVGGPPDSLFAQIGGFAFLGKQVASSPLLTSLVSMVPPLPYLPPTLRGLFTAAILVVRGVSQESKYMALASADPDTGLPRPINTVSQPSSNAEFLANQLQSSGHFLLEDGQALVLTIDPERANYFIVPTYDVWTITDDYWNKQTSLNKEQAIANDDGTYTFVISPTDPGVTNWVDTGGLHQGTISIRFQDLGPDPEDQDAPRIVAQQVIDAADAADFYADDPKYFVDEDQRADQLAARKAGFDRRWAPFPQP